MAAGFGGVVAERGWATGRSQVAEPLLPPLGRRSAISKNLTNLFCKRHTATITSKMAPRFAYSKQFERASNRTTGDGPGIGHVRFR